MYRFGNNFRDSSEEEVVCTLSSLRHEAANIHDAHESPGNPKVDDGISNGKILAKNTCDDEISDASDESDTSSRVGSHVTGSIVKYAKLREDIAHFAAASHFAVNYETDSGKKYKGRTRVLCQCNAAGQAKKKEINKEDDVNLDSFSSVFSKKRRRVSLKTKCPWRIVAWTDTKPLSGDTLVTISLISNVHNCKPCVEQLEVRMEKGAVTKHLPESTLKTLYTLVRYGSDMRRIRMFIINEGLNLNTDAQSIVNLKLLL
jgi:hypothetical protein